ncbi:MAG: 7TM-DISM domain-containing protein [Saprospiraceae bacterium]
MKTYTLIICFLFLFLKQGICLDTLFVNDDFKKIDVKEVGYLHITKNHAKDIQRISSLKPNLFKPIRETGLSFAPTNEVYWIRVTIKNTSQTHQDIMVNMEYPLMNLLQFYTVSNQRIDSSKLMGDNFPFYQRPIEHHYFLHPFKIQQGEVINLYIYFHKANENLQLFTSISTTESFNKADKKNTIIWSIYIGLSLCLFLIIISAAIFTGQKLLIYFAIYSICTFMVIFTNLGWGFQYFWFDYPAFNQVANYSFIIVFILAFLELTRQFLNMSVTLPNFSRLYTSLQIITLLLIGVLFTFKTYPPLILVIVVYIGHIFMIVTAISLLLAPILAYRKTKNYTYLVYILGFIFFLSSFGVHLLATLDVIEDTDWTRYSVPIGLTIDMTILMIIFSHRIRQTYQKNTELQQQLTQSQLNAANLLLEGQLEERKRLSQELHDGISIKMALLKMQLNNFFKNKGNETTAIITKVDTISEDIRSFTHAISPLNLEEETLEDAIEDLIYKIENQTDLEIDLSLIHFEEEQLKNNQKHNLYQILQELFNNTIKYAEATLIKIHISTINQQLQFNYQDNGKGFDVNTAKSGIGLKNIQARINLLNGNSDIYSTQYGSYFEFSFNL